MLKYLRSALFEAGLLLQLFQLLKSSEQFEWNGYLDETNLDIIRRIFDADGTL